MKNLSQIVDKQTQNNVKFKQCCSKLKKLLQKCQSQSTIVPYKICQKVYVGNISSASNDSFLQGHNIKLIISCLQIQPTHKFNDISYRQVPIKDRQNQPIGDYFESVWNWIQSQSGNVLIHCWGGKSRSVAVALSYLVKKQKNKLSFQEIYEQVKRQYPIAKVNSYFLNQLKKYQFAVNSQQTQKLQKIQDQTNSKSKQLSHSGQKMKQLQENQIKRISQIARQLLQIHQNTVENLNQRMSSPKKIDNNISLLDLTQQHNTQIPANQVDKEEVCLVQQKKQQLCLLDFENTKNVNQNLLDLEQNTSVVNKNDFDLIDINHSDNIQLKQTQDITANGGIFAKQQSQITQVKQQSNDHHKKQQELQQQNDQLNNQSQQKPQNQQQLSGSGQARKKKKKKKNKK